ncbi:MAG TPA: hypothetical protein VM388_10315, partial [Acidimicrobiales bacterium]|nr:hypothetical protein [Acidimicrobiales bacterium]
MAALATVVVCIAAPFVALGPAFAGVGFGVVPTFPTNVTVGQSGLPASLTVSNVSTPPENAAPVTLTSITLVPSCGTNAAAFDCPAPDPNVFQLSPTGVGEAGTACAGTVFTITQVDPAQGKYQFTPATPVVLQPPGQPGDTCRINFTFDVVRAPAIDAVPGAPGVQTAQLGGAIGTSNLNGNLGTGSGTSVVTVAQATPAIATLVSAPAGPGGATPTVDVGSTFTDTATVTGVPNGPAPTGTVTFAYVYDPPGAAPCSGTLTPLAPSSPLVPGATVPPSSTATSPPVTANQPGTYRFIATYSGDANYTALPATPCGAPGENVIVQAMPTLATVAASSNPAAPPGTATIPETVSDTAIVTGTAGAPAPTGTVTFTRFFDAPGAAPCCGPSTVIGPVPLTPVAPATNPPSSTASTPPFAPTGPGTVRFLASYSGDAVYAPLPNTPCGEPGENVTVQAVPTLVTLAASSDPAAPPGTATTGDTITDTATVTGSPGGPVPTGTVTFTRYFDAPGAAPCSGPSAVIGPVGLTPAVPATTPPSATAVTPAFAPPGPGTVRYTASYSGDANYTAVPTTACGEPGENVTVTATPTLVTLAASSNPSDPAGVASPGTTVSDTATVTGIPGGPAPTGTVTFTRFFDAPGAAPCCGPS